MAHDHTETAGITPEEFRERQERVRALCREQGWDALVAFGRAFYDRPGDVAYLTNHFPPFPTTPFYGRHRAFGYSAVVIPTDGPVILCNDGPYRQDLVVADRVVQTGNLGQTIAQELAAVTTPRKLGVAGLDVAPAALIWEFQAHLRDVEIADASSHLWRWRMAKSPAEQILLRTAARIADAGLSAAIAASEPEVPETHICAVGTATALRAGADFVRYLRVHTGPWSEVGSRWPQATRRVVEEGDIVYLDIIGAFRGYQFDVLRTTVAGTATKEVTALLEATLNALMAALEAVKPGAVAADLYRAMKRSAVRDGFGDHLGPFAGHGIGLDTVEPPFITAEDETVLCEGMVLCIEPKLVLPGVGGASIEYEVIVTSAGPEVITELPGRQW